MNRDERRFVNAKRLSRAACAALAAIALAACGGGGGGGGGGGDLTTPNDPGNTAKPPTITSFSPTEGPVGAQVFVSGSNFGATAAANTVRFNGVAATVLSANSTELVAVVPAGATSGPIQIVTAGGAAVSSSAFTVTSGPAPGTGWQTRTFGPGVGGSVSHGAIAHNGTRFVAVGSGAFEASQDARVWTTTREIGHANDVAWNGQIFVAVGSSFWVQTSPDGLTWTTRDLPNGSSSRLLAVAAGPSLWVAVGESGAILSSPDGANWSARSSNTTKDLVDVVWAANRFVAVGADGAVVTSPDGLDWTLQAAPTTDSFTAVGGSSSLLAASTFPYPGSRSQLLTSTDGVEWSPVPTDLGSFVSIVYAGGRFVATGFYKSATSIDGVVWTQSETLPGILESVVYVNDEYFAVGSDGGSVNTMFASPDGLNWRIVASGHSLNRVARSAQDGRLVAVGVSHVIRTSTDNGATWTYATLGSLGQNYPFIDVVWSPSAGAFVGHVQVAANQYAYTSVDGAAWTERNYMPCSGALAASPTRLVNVGASLVGACMGVSSDGANWTSVTPPSSSLMQGVFWSGSQFVAVGSQGLIATSVDGTDWTLRTSNVSATLYGGVGSSANLVVVGANGTILTSTDHGATWTQRASGVSSTLRRVAFNGSEYLVFGAGRSILRSSTGENWTTESTPYTKGLNDGIWLPDASRWVVVGSAGLVATSSP